MQVDVVETGETESAESEMREGEMSMTIMLPFSDTFSKRKTVPPNYDIRTVLATSLTLPTFSKSAPKVTPTPKETIVINGKRYVQADMHHIPYRVANNETTRSVQINK